MRCRRRKEQENVLVNIAQNQINPGWTTFSCTIIKPNSLLKNYSSHTDAPQHINNANLGSNEFYMQPPEKNLPYLAE